MSPAMVRGDILFLNLGTAPLRSGEIVVYNIAGRDIPIVHRAIKIHERTSGGHVDMLTKVRQSFCGLGYCAPCADRTVISLASRDTMRHIVHRAIHAQM
jgi:hypothetical protein